MHDGDVTLVNLTGGESIAKLALHFFATRQNQQARRCHIQAMHDQGIWPSLQRTVDQAVLLVRTAARNGKQSSRFVEHQQMLVFIEAGRHGKYRKRKRKEGG